MKTKSIKMTDKERIKQLESGLADYKDIPVSPALQSSKDKSTVTAELNILSGQLVDLQKAVYQLGDKLNPVTRHEPSTISAIPANSIGKDEPSNLLLTNTVVNLQQFVGQIQATVEYLTRNNIL